jgi:hypothetical protein
VGFSRKSHLLAGENPQREPMRPTGTPGIPPTGLPETAATAMMKGYCV